MVAAVRFLKVLGKRLEYRLVAGGSPQSSHRASCARPHSVPDRCNIRTVTTLVLLHEGLGSTGLWRDFPERLAERTGCDVLAYSRYGYGLSDTLTEPRPADYLAREALDTLPELLAQLDIKDVILIGHSDGASIALIHAAAAATSGFAHQLRAVVVMAPHVFAEDETLRGAQTLRETYRQGAMRKALARHHRDVDSVFYGWNDAWLSEAFRSFDIRPLMQQIACPVLAIQGRQDEHGTMAHLQEIADRVPDTQILEIDDCRHSPHLDQTAVVVEAIAAFCKNHGAEQRLLPARLQDQPQAGHALHTSNAGD